MDRDPQPSSETEERSTSEFLDSPRGIILRRMVQFSQTFRGFQTSAEEVDNQTILWAPVFHNISDDELNRVREIGEKGYCSKPSEFVEYYYTVLQIEREEAAANAQRQQFAAERTRAVPPQVHTTHKARCLAEWRERGIIA